MPTNRRFLSALCWRHSVVLFATLAVAGSLASADDAGAPTARPPVKDAAAGPAAKIQWFGTWARAKAEAARTGMPILVTAAAPHCRGISGIW